MPSNTMHFKGFPKKGLTFLNKIIVNNSKEWLDANREEYEQVIVSPNKAYVEEMGEHLQILVPTINAIPKTNKSLFRIYRDARFHLADPIKTRIGVIFWQGSRVTVCKVQVFICIMTHRRSLLPQAYATSNLPCLPPTVSTSKMKRDEQNFTTYLKHSKPKAIRSPKPNTKECQETVTVKTATATSTSWVRCMRTRLSHPMMLSIQKPSLTKILKSMKIC